MPWRTTCPMDQRERFINDWLREEWCFSELCRSYGISRKTGYKWLERFKAGGMAELADDSRAHRGHPATTPEAIQRQVLALRQRHPFWGPRKLKSRLERLHPQQQWPASSTVGELLKRHGLVVPRRGRARTPSYVGPFYESLAPNDVWAADFKGWFRTQDGSRIDPLTVTDQASRYLIRCRAVEKTDAVNVKAQLTTAFREYGLPKALRTDNGVPFATVGLAGLSELSVWLIRLGVTPERIRPAHPEENGAHERMHRTLKQQTAKPPADNPKAQQDVFDHFRVEFNDERPHEYLGMRPPSDVYTPSPRPFPQKLPELEYAAGDTLRLVTTNGTINFKDKRIYLSNALIDQTVKVEENDKGWNVWYGPVLLGELDLEKEEIKRRPTKVLPMIPV